MDGLAAIGSRIAEINAQLAQLSAPAVANRGGAGGGAAAWSASSVTGASTTSSTAGSGSVSGTAFADQLQTALAGAATPSAATARPAPTGSAGSLAASGSMVSGASGVSAVSAVSASPAGSAGSGDFRTSGVAAVSSAATGGITTPTHRTGIARLTSSGVPVELARYGNGRVPPSALESIGGGHRLWAPAAEAFDRLRTAARNAGVSIGVTDSYRSYAQQVDVARRKGLHSQGGLAAKPGTSEHGWGKSLDLRLDTTALHWMRRHANDFGFTENVSREPWHWTYAAR